MYLGLTRETVTKHWTNPEVDSDLLKTDGKAHVLKPSRSAWCGHQSRWALTLSHCPVGL
jgi:hypothetical protein